MNNALSRAQFCAAFGISRGLLNRLIRNGSGPKIMRVGRRVLISHEAAQEWRERMERETAAAMQKEAA